MKILLPKDKRVRQFGTIKVRCTDSMMAEILAAKDRWPRRNVERYLEQIKAVRSGKESFFEFMFYSGAKLKVDTQGGFYIYAYNSDGKDGLMAAEELKMMKSLRDACRHYMQMFVVKNDCCAREPDLESMVF